MRKGLVRSPFMSTRKVAQPILQNFTGYVLSNEEVTDLIRKLSAIYDEFTGKANNADSLLNRIDNHINQSEQAVNRLTEIHDGIRIAYGEKGESGKDGRDADEDKIFKKLLTRIPEIKSPDVPIVNYDRIRAEVLASIEIKDGRDAEIDYDKMFNILKEKLKIEHIPGLRGEIDSYRNQIAGQVYGKDTWARGGGDTVVQGTNISITANKNGQKVISSTSGGSSPLIPSGTVNGVNQTFGVISQPSSVVADGITYYEGFGYSYSSLQITLSSPPAQYIRYYA